MAGTRLLSPGPVSPLQNKWGTRGRTGGTLAALDEEGEEEEIEEGAKPKMIMLPTMPSAREVEEHNMTHCPYRAWCEECVMGAGVAGGHRKVGDVGGIPVVSIDYMWLEERGHEERGSPILVGWLR